MYSFLYPTRILMLRDTNSAQLVFGIRRTHRIQKGYVYPNTFLGYKKDTCIPTRAGRCSYPLISEYVKDTNEYTRILENLRIQHGYRRVYIGISSYFKPPSSYPRAPLKPPSSPPSRLGPARRASRRAFSTKTCLCILEDTCT